MPLPLEGIRVIDWTIWQQGPVCSAILGDLGADVIKIEDRVSGDPGRGVLAISGIQTSDRPNFYFEANNRNKRGITLDLKKPEGREIVHRLAEKSDVLVQNFRRGVADRLGIGYADLRKRNPKIIYASANGLGTEGAEAASPSFDYLGLARSGIMYAAGEPNMPPLGIAGGIADQSGAIMLAFGVMTALFTRERFGVGQEVDSSLLSSLMFVQGLSLASRLVLGRAMPRTAQNWTYNPLWNHYRCADDQWIALAMLQPDRYWKGFCRALGAEALAEDPRFLDQQARMINAGDAIRLLDEAFAKRPRAEWLEILGKSGEFVVGPVNDVNDLPDDPQVKANRFVRDFEHPGFGTMQVIGMPFRLGATPGDIRRAAPEHGQHTEEILTEVLGCSWDEIGRLRENEVI